MRDAPEDFAPLAGDALVKVEDLEVRDGAKVLLHDVSLEIRRGEVVTIVGPNGGGKTTLLRAVIGAQPPSRGRVRQSPKLRIGYVPQRLAIDRTFPMTVERFLSLADRGAGRAVSETLARVGAERLAKSQLVDLSGGELQRAMLARALLRRPDLLVLDEPTQGLDQPGEAAFYRLIDKLRAEDGVAVLMASHELHVVMASSDRVLCLNGHICCQGAPQLVSEHPEYRRLFGPSDVDAVAIYRHEHDHSHDDRCSHRHDA